MHTSKPGFLKEVDNVSKMGATAAEISHELRSEYILGYRPENANADGKRRQIKLRLIDLPQESSGLHAAYRSSYVIPKQK